MPRKIRAPKLETRTARLKLAVRRKPYFTAIAPGVSLGYRRTTGPGGTWVARCADGHGGSWTRAFGTADDHEEAGAGGVLDFWAAADKARTLARAGEGSGERPATVDEALTSYEDSLKARGGDLRNVSRVRHNLPASLAAKPVGLLTPKELRAWRDGMVKAGMSPSGADRTARCLQAALSQAANDDARIGNASAWRTGLARLPDSDQARNVILSDEQVRAVIAAAYALDPAYGLFVELAAVTGARRSQLLRLRVDDLQDAGTAPRLMMPSSRKGKRRKVERKALPIPTSLAVKLRQAAIGRANDAPLLVQVDGSAHPVNDIQFARAAAAAELDPGVTAYALRHSSIVRQLLAGTPARLVAAAHDTSLAMLEKTYSKHIAGDDAADTMLRRAMLDLSAPPVENVVAIGSRK